MRRSTFRATTSRWPSPTARATARAISFVNGQYTSQGGTHQAASARPSPRPSRSSTTRTTILRTSARRSSPPFRSRSPTRSSNRRPRSNSAPRRSSRACRCAISSSISLGKHLDDYLHKHSGDGAGAPAEDRREREGAQGHLGHPEEGARDSQEGVLLNNKKLRDCKIHRTDKHELAEQSMIFITEGNSASGSITKSRDVRTQAAFSLRGKPLNCYGLTKRWSTRTRSSTSCRLRSTSRRRWTTCAITR